MKNTILFPDKTSLDEAIGNISIKTKATAFERDTQTNWFNKPITYNTVDLGLPSGLLWADRNIGARTPEDGGLYFQWGDIQGYTAEQVGTDKLFADDWSDYKFGISPDFTKYNSKYGKAVLDPGDDAAHVLMGGDWRLPTHEELYELVTNTDMFLVPTDGEEIIASITTDGQGRSWTRFHFATTAETCTGMKFYKKDDHSVYLFVPAVGVASDGSVVNVESVGVLWSSYVDTDSTNIKMAWDFNFRSTLGYGNVSGSNRCVGCQLRGVSPQ